MKTIKGMIAASVLWVFPSLTLAGEVTLTCERDPDIIYKDGSKTDINAPYTIWLSADRKLARVSSLTMSVHEFEIIELGEDTYTDTVTTIGKGKPDLEFFLGRNDLGVIYNRGYASGDRISFLGKCKLKAEPKI